METAAPREVKDFLTRPYIRLGAGLEFKKIGTKKFAVCLQRSEVKEKLLAVSLKKYNFCSLVFNYNCPRLKIYDIFAEK